MLSEENILVVDKKHDDDASDIFIYLTLLPRSQFFLCLWYRLIPPIYIIKESEWLLLGR